MIDRCKPWPIPLSRISIGLLISVAILGRMWWWSSHHIQFQPDVIEPTSSRLIPGYFQYQSDYIRSGFDNFTSVPDGELEKLTGQWILVENWVIGRLDYSRDRDLKQAKDALLKPLEYGIEIERNRIRCGHVVQPNVPSRKTFLTSGRHTWEKRVIWGAQGLYTFTIGDGDQRYPPEDDWDFVSRMDSKTYNRGSYLVDGNKLYLFWIESHTHMSTGLDTRDIEMPDYIPVHPKLFDSMLMILERPAAPLKIDFKAYPFFSEIDAQGVLGPENGLPGKILGHPDRPFGLGNPIIRSEGGEAVLPGFDTQEFDPKNAKDLPNDAQDMLLDLLKPDPISQ